MKVSFYTLGCKVNLYDTQSMMAVFENEGWEVVEFGTPCDATVVNSCTVTAMSDKKTRQMISRAHSISPEGVTIVAGCYAQRDAEKVLTLPGVYVAIGNKNRGAVARLAARALLEKQPINAVTDIMKAREFEELPAEKDGHTRATLKIQDGCNRFCSYCIIPYARGPIRSRTIENIRAEVERLCAMGFVEFVLTGIHLASYGKESGSSLIEAIEAVTQIKGVRRIRLGSLEPLILTEEFCAYCAQNEKLCRQFHVSMQSGSDTVLKRMNRRYTSEQFFQGVCTLRKHMSDAAVTTDVIAGFCEETEEEHKETLAFVEKVAFARIHVFPYSRREGTKAATMPDMDKHIKERRAAELIELGKKLEVAYIDSMLGTVQQVLMEQEDSRGRMCGYTGTYIHTAVEGAKENEIVTVKLVGRDGGTAIGERVE